MNRLASDGMSTHQKQVYYNKSFNTWNVSVKKWNDQLATYVGIDNIFNKKDYDLNIWGSLIRVGMNLKL